ncbi:MAG: hypothetical protein LBS18_00240 [Clostridiales bacterium]|jgi:hypothetical protein|nr:hypothetical protein [Clostridiales bacterium]
MDFILSHWHCILPAIGIVAALFFMRDKKGDGKHRRQNENEAVATPRDYQDNQEENHKWKIGY